jgi:hypothetical protein
MAFRKRLKREGWAEVTRKKRRCNERPAVKTKN